MQANGELNEDQLQQLYALEQHMAAQQPTRRKRPSTAGKRKKKKKRRAVPPPPQLPNIDEMPEEESPVKAAEEGNFDDPEETEESQGGLDLENQQMAANLSPDQVYEL
jgi:hypothetical protein